MKGAGIYHSRFISTCIRYDSSSAAAHVLSAPFLSSPPHPLSPLSPSSSFTACYGTASGEDATERDGADEREREREKERRVGLDGTPKEEEGGERGEGRGRGHPLSFLSSALQRRREGEEFTILQIIISFEHRAYLTFCCRMVQFFLDAVESLLFPPSFSPLPPCPRAGPFLFSLFGGEGGGPVSKHPPSSFTPRLSWHRNRWRKEGRGKRLQPPKRGRQSRTDREGKG